MRTAPSLPPLPAKARHLTPRRLCPGASVVVALGLALGCSPEGGAAGAAEGRRFGLYHPRSDAVLRMALSTRVLDVDPLHAVRPTDALLALQLFGGLTERDDAKHAHRLALASAMHVDETGRDVTLTLRESARWSNGAALTADEVVWSLAQALRPSSGGANVEPLFCIENARALHEGTLLRIQRAGMRPERAPFIVLGDEGAAPSPLDAAPAPFALGSLVLARDSNLREPLHDEVALRGEPSATAPVVGTLGATTIALVLSRRTGGRDNDVWTELRPPSGGRSGWVLEAELRASIPIVDMRHVRGERRTRDGRVLRAQPTETATALALLDDDDEVEFLRLEGPWARVLDVRSGRTGYLPANALEGILGERRWLLVRSVPARAGDAVVDGWVPADALSFDETVLGVTATGPRTLQLRLTGRTPDLPARLAALAWRPRPRAAVERWGRTWTDPRHILTSGAFRTARWQPRERIDLVRSPTYARLPRVQLERVELPIVDDGVTALHLYRAGYLDVMDAARLPPRLVESLEGALEWRGAQRRGLSAGDDDAEVLLVAPEITGIAASADRLHAFEAVRRVTSDAFEDDASSNDDDEIFADGPETDLRGDASDEALPGPRRGPDDRSSDDEAAP